ncbi:MAG TPA: HAD-IA family hydrolase [Candidatus Saccharimonadales bacterium]|nr:HAD-IA family hydrolase [Candidatus Saccharimonadales bacterium]
MQPSRKTLSNIKATGLAPDYFADSVRDIDFALLRSKGVRYLVLDVDHTLTFYNTLDIDPETAAYLLNQKEQGRLDGIYIASNSRRDLTPIAGALEAVIIRPSRFKRRKPRTRFFSRIIETIGCKPEEAVMVGDKLVMDVWGGNRAGMYTVLVTPLGRDMLFDRIIQRRFWNKRYLKKHRSQ